MSCCSDETRMLERLRLFQRSYAENRRCANCGEIGPSYVCLDFGTFVCSICSGIHREFNHKVKGISLSKWNSDEIEFICSHGNQKDALVFLGNKDHQPSPPNPNDHSDLKEFIRNKYIHQIWTNKSFCDNQHKPIHNTRQKHLINYQPKPNTKQDNHPNPNTRQNTTNRNPFSFIN